MSAITVYLEQEPEESGGRLALGGGRGLGGLGASKRSMIDKLDVETSNAKLFSQYATRLAIYSELQSRSVSVEKIGKEVWLKLDKPFLQSDAPEWRAISADIQRGRLLTWTSKMNAPSFSLPAGHGKMLGTCPGAIGGQTILGDSKNKIALKVLKESTGETDYDPKMTVCQNCYAEGGNYAMGSTQIYQVLRHAWVVGALGDGTFVPTMDWAVKNANYDRDGCEPDGCEPDGKKYFRIHDSGDFFSREYLEGWREVANLNPTIKFWAPSRLWAVAGASKWVNEVNKGSKNLIIRPSSYLIDGAAPSRESLGEGWSAHTTVISPGQVGELSNLYDWNCKAYESADGPTCRGAESPEGKTGCRACWKKPDLSVNYTLHL